MCWWPALTPQTQLYHLARTLGESPEALGIFQELVRAKGQTGQISLVMSMDLLPSPTLIPGWNQGSTRELSVGRTSTGLSMQVSVF